MAAPRKKMGPAIFTDVYLNNLTLQDLSPCETKYWYGSESEPEDVPPKQIQYFQHMADSDVGCSEGGVVFLIKQDIKWVVAWRNMVDEENKVYTDITTESIINWEFYKKQLKNSVSHVQANNLGFKATLNIDLYSVEPNVVGKLEETTSSSHILLV
ncbi:hypothetical protein V6N11_013506 [Hibiscus sabdariffa]|uniref:Uncharacterized protein n=2 Tax=Hibiscus sabdariffa TaxID=183260 RepID=A0ABR2NJS9_9ROSI